MFPMFSAMGLTQNILFLILGASFGFAMERGGFSDSRNLAAQFYFGDMRVFKVMFSAIVVASTLIVAGTSLGLINMDLVWVNPTFLGTAIIGGAALGFGFIIGGWCPGTSLVGIATGKLDALVFVAGLFLGTFLFGATVPSFWDAYNTWGAMGQFTLMDLTGMSAGVVVISVIVVAAIGFFLTEKVEDMMGERAPLTARQLQVVLGGTGGLILLALVSIGLGAPTVEDRINLQSTELDATLAAREVQMDPGEVLKLMSEFKVPVRIVDVRSPSDYNMFHLKDAEPLPPVEEQGAWLMGMRAKSVVILIGNDEDAATHAWKELMVQKAGKPLFTPYILAGGMNGWVEAYGHHTTGLIHQEAGEDQFHYRFKAPVGSNVDLARPDLHHAPEREYVPKFKQAKSGGGGGCG
ncbi:MAG: YeeE/YedE family protein [Deltaproteobacteria bacterium]|nr:YeeE/YedE family protein [Deltaproteobacteria bacterium]